MINRFEFGSVVVMGWDRDVLQATATRQNGSGRVLVQVNYDLSDAKRILVIAAPEAGSDNAGRVRLEVRVPHYIELEAIQVPKAEVEIKDVSSSVEVRSGSGSINLQGVAGVKVISGSGDLSISNVVGSVTVRKASGTSSVTDVEGSLTGNFESGNIRIAKIGGPIDVATSTANLDINAVKSDVFVVSINGKTNIRCAEGRVEVRDTSGVIALTSVAGDVDVTTSNGRAIFTGRVYAGRRYRLKTLAGVVQMAVPEDSGFSAKLSSYARGVETDFEINADSSSSPTADTNRRIVGTHGDGRSRIELDSFNGKVRLSKIASNTIGSCERQNR
jgi:hypothetical protein